MSNPAKPARPRAPSRRAILAGAAALSAWPLDRAEAATSRAATSWAPDSLNAAAMRKGLRYGSMVNITSLRRDPAYRAAIARECGLAVAENEMKMLYALPRRDTVSFQGGDETVGFALENGQRMRGHCLIWHQGIPGWLLPELSNARGAETVMRRWITGMAGRYRGRIEAWDVVNEILAPQEGRADGLRPSPWLNALGPRYVDLAFAMLRDADPLAAGVWNEDDVELSADYIDQRRALVLKTMEGLLKRGVPVRRFGLQGHIYSTRPLDEKKLRAFLRELGGMGLSIEVTEFDVDDRAFPADFKRRDAGVAAFGKAFLDVVLDEPAVLNITSWGLSNAGSWLNVYPERKRPDGLAQRALPLDEDFRPTPLRDAMLRAFAGAPDHSVRRRQLRSA